MEEDSSVLLFVKTESVPQGRQQAGGRSLYGELWVLLELLTGQVSLLAYKFAAAREQLQGREVVVAGGTPGSGTATVNGSLVVNVRQRLTVPQHPLHSPQCWTNRNVLEGRSLPFIRHPFEPCVIRGFQ